MNDTISRRFEMSIELDATPEQVWKALTDGQELARWFPLRAEVTPGVGGKITISWGPECEGTAPITAWEPGRRFQWTETHQLPGDAAPVNVTVDFRVEARGRGNTQLKLVQSGAGQDENWNGYYDSISRGWNFELRGLRHYLRHHRGEERRVVWARKRVEAPDAEVAPQIIGPQGRILRGRLAGLAEGDMYALAAVESGPSLEGTVQVNNLPRSFAATVPALRQACFRFEIEDYAGGREAWLWLSTYGLRESDCREIEQSWKAALDRVIG